MTNQNFQNYSEELRQVLRCSSCGEICDIVEETFDYAGTHCNHGQAGTYS